MLATASFFRSPALILHSLLFVENFWSTKVFNLSKIFASTRDEKTQLWMWSYLQSYLEIKYLLASKHPRRVWGYFDYFSMKNLLCKFTRKAQNQPQDIFRSIFVISGIFFIPRTISKQFLRLLLFLFDMESRMLLGEKEMCAYFAGKLLPFLGEKTPETVGFLLFSQLLSAHFRFSIKLIAKTSFRTRNINKQHFNICDRKLLFGLF